jgi:hypothetical protein
MRSVALIGTVVSVRGAVVDVGFDGALPPINTAMRDPIERRGGGTVLATQNDIKGVLGDIDPAEMLAIMSLRPTIADIEQASVWLEGDPDVFGAGEAIHGVASEIFTILKENEEEEPPRAG